MSENKEKGKVSFPWQIGLLVALYFVIYRITFFHYKTSQFYIFQNIYPIFGGKVF